jgi:signal transduction histidine kinase
MLREKQRKPAITISGGRMGTKKNRLILRRSRHEDRQDSDRIKIIAETAATLGHEINNPLMVITASIESILKSHSALPDDIIDKIRAIAYSAERIKNVTEKLTNAENLTYRETACGRMIDLGKSADVKSPTGSNISEISDK